MSIDEVTAFHRLMFGRAAEGFALLEGVGTGTSVHPVSAETAWVSAATQADAEGLRVRARPLVHGPAVAGQHDRPMLPWQSTLVIRWSRLPEVRAVRAVLDAGGHVITVAGREHHAVFALAEDRPLGALVALGREVASVLGAERDPRWYLPVPGLGNARWLSDYSAPDLACGVDADRLVAAGLRPSAPTWSPTDARP